MKRALVLVLFGPLVFVGLVIGLCVYGVQLGIELVSQVMHRVADWVD
jgi:hypothetical protein